MPRPGPRPYECVRRAWHSDRHQPVRGSIIQEIFKLANEIHSTSTRKNKEWQKKLPFVVLKAEEIMYSKANSEAEYTDLNTLWVRANDAVDTIIRKDETAESEDLLKPCIEAALNLGCVPRRASRSQRNNSPRCYLSSGAQESTDTSNLSPALCNGNFGHLQQCVSFHLPLPVATPGDIQDNTQRFVAWCPSVGASVSANHGFHGSGTSALSHEFRDSIPISYRELALPSAKNICSNQDTQLSSPSESFSLSCTGHVYPLHYMEKTESAKKHCSVEKQVSLNCKILAACDSSTLHMDCKADKPQDSTPIFRDWIPIPHGESSTSYQDNFPSLEACIWPNVGNLKPLFENHTNSQLLQPANSSGKFNPSCVASSSLPTSLMWVGEPTFVHNFLDANATDGAAMETSNSLDLNVDLHDMEYDVSLRLGPPSVYCFGNKSSWYC